MINGWRIDVDAVASVLSNLEITAGELVTSLDGIETAYTTLDAGNTVALSAVTAAVSEVIGFEQERLTSMGNRISAGSLGLSTATSGYNLGDEQMALDAQTQAQNSASSGDLSFFGVESGS
jgi:hypothetical protein